MLDSGFDFDIYFYEQRQFRRYANHQTWKEKQKYKIRGPERRRMQMY